MPALKACQAFSRSEETVIPALRVPNLKSQRWKEGKELWIQRNLCSDRSQLVILIKNMLNPSFCLFQPSHPGSKLQSQCPHNLPNHPRLSPHKGALWSRVSLGTGHGRGWHWARRQIPRTDPAQMCFQSPTHVLPTGTWNSEASRDYREKNEEKSPAVAPLQRAPTA